MVCKIAIKQCEYRNQHWAHQNLTWIHFNSKNSWYNKYVGKKVIPLCDLCCYCNYCFYFGLYGARKLRIIRKTYEGRRNNTVLIWQGTQLGLNQFLATYRFYNVFIVFFLSLLEAWEWWHIDPGRKRLSLFRILFLDLDAHTLHHRCRESDCTYSGLFINQHRISVMKSML